MFASKHDVLKEVFGFDQFRDGQEEIVQAVIGGQLLLDQIGEAGLAQVAADVMRLAVVDEDLAPGEPIARQVLHHQGAAIVGHVGMFGENDIEVTISIEIGDVETVDRELSSDDQMLWPLTCRICGLLVPDCRVGGI